MQLLPIILFSPDNPILLDYLVKYYQCNCSAMWYNIGMDSYSCTVTDRVRFGQTISRCNDPVTIFAVGRGYNLVLAIIGVCVYTL